MLYLSLTSLLRKKQEHKLGVPTNVEKYIVAKGGLF